MTHNPSHQTRKGLRDFDLLISPLGVFLSNSKPEVGSHQRAINNIQHTSTQPNGDLASGAGQKNRCGRLKACVHLLVDIIKGIYHIDTKALSSETTHFVLNMVN